MPKKTSKTKNEKSTSTKKRKEQEYTVVEAEIAYILDERGGEIDDDKHKQNDKSTKQRKSQKSSSRSSSRSKRQKTKHEFLCAWTDGEDPQWVEAEYLEGTPALEEWMDKEEDDDDNIEEFDSKKVLKEKCTSLATLLKAAKRPCFLLGAGISAPVLPTFRGRNGLWTKDAHKNEKADAKVSDGLQPTLAHRAITALEKAGYVYWVATQNYDDLSVRSGYPESKLSELHGNIFTETCEKCNTLYRRDFEVPLDDSQNHETGRNCEDESCGGILRDSIIHFDEDLPWHDLKMSNAKFSGADLTIVLGSSLNVEPAAGLPFKAKYRRKNAVSHACIVNLQKTPYDEDADLLIRGKCDDVMDFVAKELLGKNWDVM